LFQQKGAIFVIRLYPTFVELDRPQTPDTELPAFYLKQSCLDNISTLNHAAEVVNENCSRRELCK